MLEDKFIRACRTMRQAQKAFHAAEYATPEKRRYMLAAMRAEGVVDRMLTALEGGGCIGGLFAEQQEGETVDTGR